MMNVAEASLGAVLCSHIVALLDEILGDDDSVTLMMRPNPNRAVVSVWTIQSMLPYFNELIHCVAWNGELMHFQLALKNLVAVSVKAKERALEGRSLTAIYVEY